MRSKDPELMNRIRDYRNRYILDNHHAPTQKEVAAAMNISPGTVHNYLMAMEENGMITSNDKVQGMEQSEKCSSDHVNNLEFWTNEDVEEYVSLPRSIVGKGEFYIVRADGTGMVDAWIQTGDLVVIRKQETAEMGNIVVALDDENKPTLKKYGGIDPVSGKAVLLYQNEAEYPSKRILVDKLIVLGVATNVIHTYDTCERGDDKNANK